VPGTDLLLLLDSENCELRLVLVDAREWDIVRTKVLKIDLEPEQVLVTGSPNCVVLCVLGTEKSQVLFLESGELEVVRRHTVDIFELTSASLLADGSLRLLGSCQRYDDSILDEWQTGTVEEVWRLEQDGTLRREFDTPRSACSSLLLSGDCVVQVDSMRFQMVRHVDLESKQFSEFSQRDEIALV
jgi:hypothetical protein